jgi:hypothetical protein
MTENYTYPETSSARYRTDDLGQQVNTLAGQVNELRDDITTLAQASEYAVRGAIIDTNRLSVLSEQTETILTALTALGAVVSDLQTRLVVLESKAQS